MSNSQCRDEQQPFAAEATEDRAANPQFITNRVVWRGADCRPLATEFLDDQVVSRREIVVGFNLISVAACKAERGPFRVIF
ncbi:MAG: hypothetical protein JNM18_08580 [Planctomycetaceae bacterium]|nr:hypothetical protein [Planctomycetaceae bacterium]